MRGRGAISRLAGELILGLCLLAAAVPPAQAQDPPPAAEQALNIETAVALALRNSPELRHAAYDRSLALESFRLSWRDFLPSLSLSYSHNDSVSYGLPDSRSRRLALGLEQLLYAGGARLSERRLAQTSLHLQQRELEGLRLELTMRVIDCYIEILKLRLQREILQESHRQTSFQLQIAGEELRLKAITELDYLEMELAVKDLEIELAGVGQQERQLLFELKGLLGLRGEGGPVPAGRIDAGFTGLLEQSPLGQAGDAEAYLLAARRWSVELQRQQARLLELQEALRQAEWSWLPQVSARLELSMAGDELPLTEPGISIALGFTFRAPVLPGQLALSIGSAGPQERSTGFSSAVGLAENLGQLHSVSVARLNLLKAGSELEELQGSLEFAIREQLHSRTHQLALLGLLRGKEALAEKRRHIQALMLEIGEITRLELVEGELELARLRVQILSAVVSLFHLDAALLERCGLEGPGTGLHRIIVPEEASP
jgi:outer membrane protein TolC